VSARSHRHVNATLPVTSSAWRMIASRLAAARESSRSVIGSPFLERTRCAHDVRQFQITQRAGQDSNLRPED
jgi:hypothetical protein